MSKKTSGGGTQAVETLLANSDHPRIGDIQALRALILEVDAGIGEDVKWNAPSFHTGEHLATMRLHGKPPLQPILHLGAKRSDALPEGAIVDPGGLLTWPGPDRVCVNFPASGSVTALREPLRAILRQWLAYVPAGAQATASPRSGRPRRLR